MSKVPTNRVKKTISIGKKTSLLLKDMAAKLEESESAIITIALYELNKKI